MATTPDYPILGRPRISPAGFAAVLRGGSSPAAGEAAACYAAFTAAGVDPAVGLAIFRKESTYGRFGYANRNHSWGNIREPSTGKFRYYSSWTAGARDAARLLTIYGTNRIRVGKKTDTVQTFPYVWAPSSDGNAPDAYGDSLARWIGEWSKKYPASGSSTPPLADLAIAPGAKDTTLAELLGMDPSIKLTLQNQADIQARISALEGRFSHEWVQALHGYIGALAVGMSKGGPSLTLGEIKVNIETGGALGPAEIAEQGLEVLGDALIHAVFLAAILGLLALGLYLVVTSDE